MPSPTRRITTRDVRRFVDEQVFTPAGGEQDADGRTNGRIGIELEWITRTDGRMRSVSPDELRAAVGAALPERSRLTFEPGGQLELSGPAHRDADAAICAMDVDVLSARRALAPHGVDLVGIGLDPSGARERVIDGARYQAMEQYFDTRWPDGRTMMRSTASVQVNVDLGAPALLESRWTRAHTIVPVLAAAFANSPLDPTGAATGWRSSRLGVWHRIDPHRTRAVARNGASAASAWTDYALDAPVMMIATPSGFAAMSRPLPFSRWIHDGHELGWPALDDFEYHLTTLFPPVRPRGWLELRTIDALPDEWWPVAVAVTTALLDDDEASDVVDRVATPVRHRSVDAARDACADAELRGVVDQCFVAALDALPRVGAGTALRATETYYERYVTRGRCPADDLFEYPSRLSAVT